MEKLGLRLFGAWTKITKNISQMVVEWSFTMVESKTSPKKQTSENR